MQEKDHISELFKEAFHSYEAPVKPEIWHQVSAKIQAASPAPAPDGGSTSQLATAATKATGSIGSWIAGSALVVSVVTGYYFYEIRPDSVPAKTTPTEQPVASTPSDAQGTPDRASNAGIVTGSDQPDDITVSTSDSRVSLSSTDNQSSQTQPQPVPAGNTNENNDAGMAQVNEKPAASSSPETTSPVPSVSTATTTSQQGNATPDEQPAGTEKLKIVASVLSGKAPLGVSFSVQETGISTEWNFGDGSEVYRGTQANHLFRNPGTYLVTVKNTDRQGKIYTDRVRVEVLSDLSITGVPNIFTPNGDGVNDLFQVPAAQHLDIEVSIFDNSGKFIHRFTGADGGWNGKINNREDAAVGTYFYVIFATGPNGEKNTQKGTITLKR